MTEYLINSRTKEIYHIIGHETSGQLFPYFTCVRLSDLEIVTIDDFSVGYSTHYDGVFPYYCLKHMLHTRLTNRLMGSRVLAVHKNHLVYKVD